MQEPFAKKNKENSLLSFNILKYSLFFYVFHRVLNIYYVIEAGK